MANVRVLLHMSYDKFFRRIDWLQNREIFESLETFYPAIKTLEKFVVRQIKGQIFSDGWGPFDHVASDGCLEVFLCSNAMNGCGQSQRGQMGRFLPRYFASLTVLPNPTDDIEKYMSMISESRANMINPALKPELVLSESNRKNCIERFKRFRTSKVRGAKEAAVLVPLCLYKGELSILYTLRSMKLSYNRGQVSFPGGMRDKNDVDLQETAMRETWEELKVPREKIDVWTAGHLIGKIDVNVMPILAYIGEVEPEKLEINPDEVEEAFVVSLQKLCDPELCSFTRFRKPAVTLPCYFGGKYRVWGFTGAITDIVLASLVPQVYKYKFPRVQPLQTDSTANIFSDKLFEYNTMHSKI